jgi:hypothetical protein
MAAQKQASEQAKNVDMKSHFFPVFIMMYMAIPIAGISTKPAKAFKHVIEKEKNIIYLFYILFPIISISFSDCFNGKII